MWIVNANYESTFPPTFQSGFSKSIRTISKRFPNILNGFKAFQSSRNYIKYSEKQIGFSRGNLYNLHLLSNSSPAKTWLSTWNRIFSSTSIPLWWQTLRSSESKEAQLRLLEIEAMRWYTYIQNNLKWAWLLAQETQASQERDRN